MVYSAAFSPDGTRIVTASKDNTARIWDVFTGATVMTLRGHEGAVRSVAFSPDGRRVVTGFRRHGARIWDVGTGATVMTVRRA